MVMSKLLISMNKKLYKKRGKLHFNMLVINIFQNRLFLYQCCHIIFHAKNFINMDNLLII